MKPWMAATENAFKAALSWPARLFRWAARVKYKLLVTTFLVFVALVLLSVGAYSYWSSPAFCNNCHIMEPYYQSWKTSTHKFVRCVDCHFEPGLANELRGKWVAIKQLASYLTGAYSSKPYAEISDASCLRSGCHQERLLKGKVVFTQRQIHFDHGPHLTQMRHGIKLSCTSCHSQMVIGSHVQVTPSTCFLCHFKGGTKRGVRDNPIGGCGVCHGPPEKTIQVGAYTVDHKKFTERNMECTRCHVDVTQGEGNVTQDRCFRCHNQPEKLEKFKDVEVVHMNHVTRHKVECGQCHNPIEHRFNTTLAEHQHNDCGTCHESQHNPQGLLYSGKGGRGVDGRPDPMHEAGISCSGCHVIPRHDAESAALTGQTFISGAMPCVGCHGERYTEFVSTFQFELQTTMASLEHRLTPLKAMVDTPEKVKAIPDGYRLFRLVQDSEYNLTFVRLARGIHNPFYAVELMKQCDKALAEAEQLSGVPAVETPTPMSNASCLELCHKTLPKPGTLTLKDGRKFPHPKHVEEASLECSLCHKGSHPPRSKTDEKFCTKCHE